MPPKKIKFSPEFLEKLKEKKEQATTSKKSKVIEFLKKAVQKHKNKKLDSVKALGWWFYHEDTSYPIVSFQPTKKKGIAGASSRLKIKITNPVVFEQAKYLVGKDVVYENGAQYIFNLNSDSTVDVVLQNTFQDITTEQQAREKLNDVGYSLMQNPEKIRVHKTY